MSKSGWRAALYALILSTGILGGCGKGDPFTREVASLYFVTTTVPSGGAGQLYNEQLAFGRTGDAPLADRFEIGSGTLPPGVVLMADREDLNADNIPDEDGALNGNARLLGYPRESGSYTFKIRGIATGVLGASTQTAASTAATGSLPALAAEQTFTILVGEGQINILTPTAEEGTKDPAVPSFPGTLDFVNPANPQAFFGFRFQVAGGTGDNEINTYLPRELELSVFDEAVANGQVGLEHDTDEQAKSGNKMQVAFDDGGWFTLQAGSDSQIGGFQSPRGPVGTITQYGPVGGPYTAGLDPAWFQKDPASGGPAKNSRRYVGDTSFPAGDTSLIPGRTIQFSDYFDAVYEGTSASFSDPDPVNPPVLVRRKYPFTADQYSTAFFLSFTPGVDVTSLRYYAIVEAIDKRNTSSKLDDILARKSFIVQVRIPDIKIDTVLLANGTAGIDYTEKLTFSGGVPPLKGELEWVDNVADMASTSGSALDKASLGLELGADTKQFFGVPRASATGATKVELTVRAYAAVMNPVQGGSSFIPTGNAGENSGTHPLTGKTGIHKVFQVQFALPSVPAPINSVLPGGTDGTAYSTTIRGGGGVPNMIPNPVGFVGTYPSATALRNYEWSATYVQDTSYGAGGTVASGLPKNLTLDGDPNSVTSGQISGVAFDRGFHPVTMTQKDFYLGSAATPSIANRQTTNRLFSLSVSPDSAVYMRGATTTESAVGVPSGIMDSSAAAGEARMVPMFHAAGFFTVDTGKAPKLNLDLPPAFDILPVAIANGDEGESMDKSQPSISGFWPAESNKEVDWTYYTNHAWQHLDQEVTWIQLMNHNRLFLWGETIIKAFSPGSTGGYGKKYQVMGGSGTKRGVFVLNPLTGESWIPAILDNASSTHGTQFGAEIVMGRDDGGYYYYQGIGYWKAYYYGQSDSRWDREKLSQGTGCYIDDYSSYNSSTGWYRMGMGRAGISVAVSSDGKWAATALPGGSEQKILLWKTDKVALPSTLLSKTYVQAVTGRDSAGGAITDQACILNVGGESFSGFTTATNQQNLLPDSLMFVQDGLIWMDQSGLDRIYGISTVNGTLSSRQIVSSGGITVNSLRGMYIPDQDYLRGLYAQASSGSQYAWTSNKAAAGEVGPNRIAFVAGDNAQITTFSDLGGNPRDGYIMLGNRNKKLFAVTMAKNASTGLNLAGDTMTDLTGTDSTIYGDLLPPGRLGEELDWCNMSDDGKFVAVVRDHNSNDYFSSWTFYQSFSQTQTGSSTSWGTNDDILLFSVDGEDLDSGKSGTQTVLYVGSQSMSAGAGDPSLTATYATGKGYLNSANRRINGVHFGANTGSGERSLLFNYSADDSYTTKLGGYPPGYGWGMNPTATGTFAFGVQSSIRLNFKTSSYNPAIPSSGAINFTSSSNMTNVFASTTGVGSVGPTSAPFGSTTSSDMMFWVTFHSENNKFIYFVVDGLSGRNFIVGFNITGTAITTGSITRNPYVPYIPHAATVGLEQIDVNSFIYANRFKTVPGGITYQPSGRTGAGIVFFVASDSTAGAISSTDLEVHAFDANTGGNSVVLTSGVTDGTSNAINHLYASAEGNYLVCQRSKTTASSRDSRTTLNGTADLFVVTNVHAALGGTTANAVRIALNASLGSTVAFVGEGTPTGPQAIIFSSGTAGGNNTWSSRTLKIALIQNLPTPEVLDTTSSHYVVLSGGRTLNDDPNSAN